MQDSRFQPLKWVQLLVFCVSVVFFFFFYLRKATLLEVTVQLLTAYRKLLEGAKFILCWKTLWMHVTEFTQQQTWKKKKKIQPSLFVTISLPRQLPNAVPPGPVPEEYLRGFRPYATAEDALRMPSLPLGLDPATAAAAAAYYHPSYLPHPSFTPYR